MSNAATVSTGAVRGQSVQATPVPAPPPGGPRGGSGGGGAAAVDSATRSIYQLLSSYLRDLGLGELAGTDPNGNPSGWLWRQLQGGVDTADELRVAIESTDVWRDTYGVIVEQRKRAAKGEPVEVMSVEEVNAYRKSAAQVMRNAGLPAGFYDDAKDFDQFILNGMSVAEVDDRLGESFNRAKNVAPEIRNAFEDFYGIGRGDGALAAFFLDPERTMATLERASRTAYAAGMGERYGIQIDRNRADRIARSPLTEGGITQGFEQVNRMSPVFTESLGETTDLSAGKEGVDLVFDGSGEAQSAINRRILSRQSTDRSTGGAALTNRGLIGSRSV